MNKPIDKSRPDADTCWWLALADVSGIGMKTYTELLDKYASPQSALHALANGTAKVPRVSAASAAAVIGNIGHYEAAVQRCGVLGVAIVRCIDVDYPLNLDALTHGKPPGVRPPFLYRKGEYQTRDQRSTALVGTLAPSSDGIKRAKRLAKLLVESGFTIVSGLARGIDTASHIGALEAGGRTLAVVGTGIDIIYPPENASLAAEIEQCGAVFSQFPLGAGPQKHTFPMRNQVMSGMAMATIIVEAHAKCGSLIQADFAFQQGRQVYLLRSNLDLPDNDWAHELVRKGAHVVGDIGDILDTIRSPVSARQVEQRSMTLDTPGSPKPDAAQSSSTVSVARYHASHGPPAAVLFDLEGTLYDAGSVMIEAYRHVLSENYGVSVTPEALAPLLTSSPYALLGKWLAKQDVSTAYDFYKKAYPSYLESYGRLFDDVDQLITQLHGENYRTGIVTSQARSRANLVITRFPALQKAAQVLVTWDDVVGKKKPNPYPILLALTKLNLSPARAYYVGDSVSDIQAGRNAGTKTVAVGWGLTPFSVLSQQKPDYAVQSTSELLAILKVH